MLATSAMTKILRVRWRDGDPEVRPPSFSASFTQKREILSAGASRPQNQ
jgi:hypothetical protein